MLALYHLGKAVFCQDGLSQKSSPLSPRLYDSCNKSWDITFVFTSDSGKHHYKNIAVHLGIAQIAIGPPPRAQTGTLWHLYSGKIMQMPVCTWTFLLKIGATNHPGKGLDPPPQTGNAQMNRDIFMMVLP